jgi:signal transduction histidine kinase
MWELRHPIGIGPIFEGRELSRVLRSHASAFTTITSIPAEVVQSGMEPGLPSMTRRLLFSIAHNAMTNALRHSNASSVTISLRFEDGRLRMSISDDGDGLPDDYTERGHGLRNMRIDAERMGGRLELGLGESGRGTTVTCVIPQDRNED